MVCVRNNKQKVKMYACVRWAMSVLFPYVGDPFSSIVQLGRQ